jgi:hypothetical protein
VGFLIGPALMGALKNSRLLTNAVPFFVLLFIWFVAFFYIRKRDQWRLQMEIDELKGSG